MLQANYTNLRKQRVPEARFDISGSTARLPEPSLLAQQTPLPACVLPRTRLLRRMLIACSTLSVLGMLVAYVRYYYPEDGWVALPGMLGFIPFMAVVFGLLCISARTSRGSLLQLIALLLPLLFTICACGMCWGTSSYDYRQGYVMLIGWVSMLGVMYFYLPLWLLHLLLSFIEKRRSRGI